MNARAKSRLFVLLVLLALAALACNRTAAVTPVPTLPPRPSPTVTVEPTTPPPPTATPTVAPTDTAPPLPSLSPTAVLPSGCPAPGNPVPPERPASFDAYPDTLAAYLSAGADAAGLERTLRAWGAITDEIGQVRSLEMTGDVDPEIVALLVDPAPEFDLPWPPGDLLIFRCRGGAVVPAYRGRSAVDEAFSDLNFQLLQIEDVNGTGRADVVYVTSSCGAHTCWDRLHVIEWSGGDFVDRAAAMDAYPYATFDVNQGQIVVDVGGIGSAGAGYQRSYTEVWEWDGKQFARSEAIVGPPTALVHFVHDGDEALVQENYGRAIEHYRAALEEEALPSGLFLEREEEARELLHAYARFKLVVAYAAAGDGREAQSQQDQLFAAHPQGSVGYPYALMGRAFWEEFLATGRLQTACRAAVALAEAEPALAERLYAGYANPEYQPTDLCRAAE